MDKQELAEQIKRKIEEYTTDHENWKVVKKGKDVTVYCRSSTEFQGNIYKAEGTVDAKPEKVFEFVEPKPDGLRPKWDKAIKAVDTIEKIEEGLSVMRTCTHSAAMGLISPRDFLDLCLTVKNENSICTVAGSIEHPDCPVEPKYVRGTNHPCGICCFRIDGEPDKTLVVHICQADLGGMLPTQLVETALPGNMIEFFSNLRQAIANAS